MGMEATFEGGQGPEGAVVLWMDGKSSRSHTVKNSLWKRLWTSHETDYGVNELL
jgi:hypothetical protein